MGVGHPLLEKALHQSARLQGTVCVVDGMPAPLMVFDVSSRVTDVSQSTRRVIVGVTGVAGEFTLLRDWEVLRLLNRCALRSEPFAGPVDADAVTRWRAAATQAFDPLLDSLDLQFGSRVVKESALIWPDRR
jgi:hypothetical protein